MCCACSSLPPLRQILRDPRGPKRMAADGGEDAGRTGSALDHAERVNAVHAFLRQPSGSPLRRAKERRALLVAYPDRVPVRVQITLKLVVTGERMLLAAFFMQPHPEAFALNVHVLSIHLHRGRHARKGIDQEGNEGAIP